ncbi:MAG: 16S rRNA (cytidine(1402)-2'-O)-methyltransferase, partial [Acidobacteriota bacterium]
LKTVELIACEDTRHTSKLLRHFGIERPTISYHEHNEDQRTPSLIKRLKAGQSLALVSDAGTPLLSDPGYRLVLAAHEAGIRVCPIQGPFAGAAAVSVSGLATDQVLLCGFPPKKSSAQLKQFEAVKELPATLVYYLSPHKLSATLETMLEAFGNREAFILREMTKLHETAYRGTIETLLEIIRGEQPLGEYTMVIAGKSGDSPPPPPIDLDAYITGLCLTRDLTRTAAIKAASAELGIPRRELYDLLKRD